MLESPDVVVWAPAFASMSYRSRDQLGRPERRGEGFAGTSYAKDKRLGTETVTNVGPSFRFEEASMADKSSLIKASSQAPRKFGFEGLCRSSPDGKPTVLVGP